MGNSLQFITAMHGTEFMPTLALASAGIPQIIANPLALSQRKRFIDSDLNKAFGIELHDFETKRAAELLSLIPEDATVIDIHSFTGPSPAFIIIVDPTMLNLAVSTGIKNIVYMKFSEKEGHALINRRHGISVETGQNNTQESFDTTIAVAHALCNAESTQKNTVELFEVYGKIIEEGKYVNFELNKTSSEEFYPILAGENAYDFYGLKARKVRSF